MHKHGATVSVIDESDRFLGGHTGEDATADATVHPDIVDDFSSGFADAGGIQALPDSDDLLVFGTVFYEIHTIRLMCIVSALSYINMVITSYNK